MHTKQKSASRSGLQTTPDANTPDVLSVTGQSQAWNVWSWWFIANVVLFLPCLLVAAGLTMIILSIKVHDALKYSYFLVLLAGFWVIGWVGNRISEAESKRAKLLLNLLFLGFNLGLAGVILYVLKRF